MKTCPVCDADFPDQHNTCPSDGAVLIVSHELVTGSLVRGKYRIVRKLGQGGMGVVYLAEHILLGGNVALKFLAGDLGKDPKFIKRFRMEARAAHQLRHPNIVEVVDLDQGEDGSLFIAMEYVEGKSLRDALEEARAGFSVPRALETTRGIVSGLAAAHAHGTVHRDVKPENVILGRTADGCEMPKVLDFGIAAMADSVTRLSMTHGFLLTPDYAAPEQWLEMPAAEMDGRTDLYAMGCVFYEMLTGNTPFHAHNTSGWMKQHLEETPRLPSELRPELANWTGLDGLTMRLLAKNRNDRPQDAEVLSLLDAAQSGTGQARRATVAVSDWKHPQTIIEEGSGVRHETVTTPPPQQVVQAQPVSQPAPQPVIQAQRPASQNIPVWVWGVLAVVVVMAVAVGIAAVHFFAPKPQPQQAQTTTTQPVVVPPLQADSHTYTAPNQTTTQQKPSPASPASGANVKPPNNQPSNSQTTNTAQANNTKPSIVLPNVVLPKQVVLPQFVKPQVTQPSNAEIEKQAIALFNQKRYSEAIPMLVTACTGGSGEACRDLGNMYRDGTGTGKDLLRAASLFSRACEIAPPKGCINLGVMYHNGDGVAQNDVRAGELYSKACDAGDGIGCANLGNSYWNGSGVPHDDSKAAALYSRACGMENGAGCSSLGLCYATGRGVGKDPAQARNYYNKGCKMGNSWGCARLNEMK
jgi:serine/threonine-protein kinase